RRGKELELQALEWEPGTKQWSPPRRVFPDAINNFPPEKLPNGEWLMSRRDSRLDVHVLIGGRKAIDDWVSLAVVGRHELEGFVPDEPVWWSLPDGRLTSVYRDNSGSSWLFRSFS